MKCFRASASSRVRQVTRWIERRPTGVVNFPCQRPEPGGFSKSEPVHSRAIAALLRAHSAQVRVLLHVEVETDEGSEELEVVGDDLDSETVPPMKRGEVVEDLDVAIVVFHGGVVVLQSIEVR